MNYQAIYQETAANFTTTVTNRAKVWVNMAYQEWLTRSAWSFLESSSAAVPLVASQQTYVLSGTSPVVTDFSGLISVTCEKTASGVRDKMWELDAQTFEAISASSRVIAVPVFYSIQGGTAATGPSTVVSNGVQNLVVWPIPIATAGNGVNLFVRYTRSGASIEMTNDSDVPILPAQHHGALVDGATAIGMYSYNQPQDAQVRRMTFMQRLEEAAREDLRMRNRDSQRLAPVQQPWLYPIQGQTPATFDPLTDRYPVPAGG